VLRIDPLKDVPTMIASAVTARAGVPNVVYKLWGPALDPEYLAICEKLIVDLDLTETVFLMGPTRDPASAYADAHVVALSSISEGFPFSIIEAMMCAKPVVATDVGGVREAVDRFGAVVPPKRPELLGGAIAALLRDPARARALGKEARAFALEHFTRSAFLDAYRSLYGSVAATAVTA
jgi:polysaccharide biosynthesis protein PelF